ncbi:MAG TPA: helix-turn-helix domain-containing protein [Vicinamibacterales bacterium]|nr:helix-turn-helix domain-containing protein [Vicinamibacterales bacterium]
MDERVSLSELAAAGLYLRPAEAAAVVAAACREHAAGRLPGVPTAQVIRLTADGRVVAEGPIGADSAGVARAALLLQDLTGGFDAPPEFRAPGAMRLVVARALGSLDVPPYASLDEFCAAIDRFASPDLPAVVRGLFTAWRAASGAVPPDPIAADDNPGVTISDIRRARRATGLTLDDVSAKTRIPAPLLRELEWGYLSNWPAGRTGRTQLTTYAQAVGLDERLVLRVAWPLLKAAATSRGGAKRLALPAEERGPGTAHVPIAASMMPTAERQVVVPQAPATRLRRVPLLVPLAAAAILIFGLLPASWRPDAPAIVWSAAAPQPARTAALAAPLRIDTVVADSNASDAPASAGAVDVAFVEPPAEDGEGSLRITRVAEADAHIDHARVSPDGGMVAFDSDRDGASALYVAGADGRHVHRVSGAGSAACPAWSPDGRRIAFIKTEAADPDVWNLWTVDVATGELHRRTHYRDGAVRGASWFPDGRRLAFSRADRLRVLDIGTGTARVFRAPRPGRALGMPAVSPDGQRIIVAVAGDGVWQVKVRDGSMRQVLADGTAEGFTWSSDGSQVAFHSQRANGWRILVTGRQ